ncbi:MAG TPA: DUF4954 domain-containing protein [Porphyromonadaceae bacterium]|nr:DUF4954 domain-containing protein [Porphyromonadaceae bacterium]
MEYRKLTTEEIEQLKRQNCASSEWESIEVSPRIEIKYIRQVRFSGSIRLGYFEKSFELPGGVHKHTGLFNVVLHNVDIGNNCCIENVKNYIANYQIEENVFIENVDTILTEGETSFGNGVEVIVLNEMGGNEVIIHDKLSAQEAYMEACYRDRPLMVKRLKSLGFQYAKEMASTFGKIEKYAKIINAGYIKNVKVGAYCEIEGIDRLQNGTIVSNEEAPVYIGCGVTIDDFIIQQGTKIIDNVSLSACYVGEACVLAHGYSATNSLFFCNCHEENGEACSAFAGPFTVTHHKSSLLIAGLFSFMNAGSGSNQSNHLYKLGPIHHGILERGSKTTSDSYILWPARVGAFSLIMGRHTSHLDTENMPFSYLVETDGKSCLIPAINLKSVGTIRDSRKWPKRDKRVGNKHLDCVNFNLLSPYTIGKMVKAVKILKDIVENGKNDTTPYKNTFISMHSALRGIKLYTIAIRKFIGNSLTSHLERTDCSSAQSILEHLPSRRSQGEGDWVDISGLIAPKKEIALLIGKIEQGIIQTTEELNAVFYDLHSNYYRYEWTWAYSLMLEFYHLDAKKITIQDLIWIIKDWKEAVVELDEMLFKDAEKDVKLSMISSYGFEGETDTTFEEEFNKNLFVQDVHSHIASKTALAEYWEKVLMGVK